MKKIFTILISLIMLSSGMKVSIDHHYCGGFLAGTKLSLSGELASCGMEPREHNSSDQISFGNLCCEDDLTFYGMNNNFLPEYLNLIPPADSKELPSFPVYNTLYRSPYVSVLNSWVLPPGEKINPEQILSRISILRI